MPAELFALDPELLGLVDEVALVLGGGGAGMGRSHCLQLARAGCHLVVADRDAEGGPRTVEEVEALGRLAIAEFGYLTGQSLPSDGGPTLTLNRLRRDGEPTAVAEMQGARA